jgi:hypothetical protein
MDDLRWVFHSQDLKCTLKKTMRIAASFWKVSHMLGFLEGEHKRMALSF